MPSSTTRTARLRNAACAAPGNDRASSSVIPQAYDTITPFAYRSDMSVAGRAGSLQGTTSVRWLEAVLQAVAGAADGDDVAVVQQPVQDGRGQHVVAEHAAPLAERLVAGQQDRAALIAAGDQLEDH